MDNELYTLFFICAPLGYWFGMKLASVTSLASARDYIEIVSVHGTFDPENEPTLFTKTVIEIIFIPVIVAVASIFFVFVSAIPLIPLIYIGPILPTSLAWLLDKHSDSALFLYFSAFAVGYVGRVALTILNEEKRLVRMIEDHIRKSTNRK